MGTVGEFLSSGYQYSIFIGSIYKVWGYNRNIGGLPVGLGLLPRGFYRGSLDDTFPGDQQIRRSPGSVDNESKVSNRAVEFVLTHESLHGRLSNHVHIQRPHRQNVTKFAWDISTLSYLPVGRALCVQADSVTLSFKQHPNL